jgi:hypothetical protein
LHALDHVEPGHIVQTAATDHTNDAHMHPYFWMIVNLGPVTISSRFTAPRMSPSIMY